MKRSSQRINPKIPTILGEISLAILSLLRDRPGLTWGQIIKDLKRNRDTVGPKISKLVKKGYIRKDSNRYYLTPFSDLMFEKALTVDSGVIEVSDQRVTVSPDHRVAVKGVKVSPAERVKESTERATVKEATVKGVTVSPNQQLPVSPDQRLTVSPIKRVTDFPEKLTKETLTKETPEGVTVKGVTVSSDQRLPVSPNQQLPVSPVKRVTDIPTKVVTNSPTKRGKHKHVIRGFTLALYEYIKDHKGISVATISKFFLKRKELIKPKLSRLKDYGLIINDSGKWYLASKVVTENQSKSGRPKKSISGFTLVLYEFIKKNEGLDAGAISQRLCKENDIIRHYLHRLKDYGLLINDNSRWYISSKSSVEAEQKFFNL